MSTLGPRGPSARRMSIETANLTHRPATIQRLDGLSRQHEEPSPPGTPSELSTPNTPNGHPLGTFQALLTRRVQPTPLPVIKIMPLCIARVAEGLIFAVIFPYINEMMQDFGVPEESVGIWSATAESTLMVTESVAAPLYAPLADRLGRRTVFVPLVGLWGAFSVAFGFAQSPWGAIFFRACLGLLAGAGVISRTMLGELCDKTNRIQGFALFSPAFTVGVTIAPLIGGFLSRPVPRLLSEQWTLFVAYPYLLPSLVTGAFGFAASLSAYRYLPETIPTGLRSSSSYRYEAEKATTGGGLKTLITYPKFFNVLILYGLNNAVMFSWEAIYPLFAFTGKDLGGLGLTTQQIGVVLAFGAGMSIFMTVWLFPILHQRIPEGRYLQLCLMLYPPAVALFPLLWALNRNYTGGLSSGACMILVLQMLLRRAGDFSSTILDTIVMDAIPGPEYLAMANSITFSMAAVGRAVGPFIVSSFFSLATTSPNSLTIKRQLVWVVFILVCLPSIYFGRRMGQATPLAVNEEEEHELYDDSVVDEEEDTALFRAQ